MERWTGKVAIVTGASAGIGAAIAQKLVEEGLIVVGVARRSDLIEALSKKLSSQKGKLYAQKADMTKEEDILRVFEWTSTNLGPIHVLINNAGSAKNSTLSEGRTEDWTFVVNLNVIALSVSTREAIKIMTANKINGHIIHINSVLGHTVLPIPNLGIYPASKFAVTALTETLRQELVRQGSKIKITSLSPGLTESEATTVNTTVSPERKAFYERSPKLKGEDIADGVVYALSTPEHVQIHELTILPLGL